jgi:hypothetical protein
MYAEPAYVLTVEVVQVQINTVGQPKEEIKTTRVIKEGIDRCMALADQLELENSKNRTTLVRTANGSVTTFVETDLKTTITYSCTPKAR